MCGQYGLLPRDLRKIDSSNLPHILVRPSAILLNLLHLKVLIKHDRVLLFDVYGSTTSYPQSAFMYELQGKLQQKQTPGANNLPYEFRALEAVLMSVTSELEADFEAVRDPVIRVLAELEDDIDRDKLRVLLVLSKRVSTFEQKARLVRDALEELLEADDDLADMYLTEKTHDLFRGEDDHTEIELLLESYNKICDEVVQEASNLVSSIRNTEEMWVAPEQRDGDSQLTVLQYPCDSRRQPQRPDAAGPQVQRRHARAGHGHVPRRPLRDEPQQLYRGGELGLRGGDGGLDRLLADCLLVRAQEVAQGAADQDGRPGAARREGAVDAERGRQPHPRPEQPRAAEEDQHDEEHGEAEGEEVVLGRRRVSLSTFGIHTRRWGSE